MAPTLTILAPTHDRPEVLARVWPTWMEQQGLAEIVIVNDGSTKDYREVFREMSEACSARSICLKVLHNNERRGAPAAKNLGLEHCTSQEILTTDDDILLPKSMVTYCREERPQLSTPVIVGPRVIYLKDGESEEAALARANQDTSKYFNYRTLTITPWVSTGKVEAFPFVTAVALWPADLFKRGLRYYEGYGGNGYREETDPQLAACSDYSAQIFLVPNALCFHLPPSLAYASRSGQRRGNRLWFEFWVHYNNFKFINRFKNRLMLEYEIRPMNAWLALLFNRLSPARIINYIAGNSK